MPVEECPVTLTPFAREGPDQPVSLACGHVFSYHAVDQLLKAKHPCPLCRQPILVTSSNHSRAHQQLGTCNNDQACVASPCASRPVLSSHMLPHLARPRPCYSNVADNWCIVGSLARTASSSSGIASASLVRSNLPQSRTNARLSGDFKLTAVPCVSVCLPNVVPPLTQPSLQPPATLRRGPSIDHASVEALISNLSPQLQPHGSQWHRRFGTLAGATCMRIERQFGASTHLTSSWFYTCARELGSDLRTLELSHCRISARACSDARSWLPRNVERMTLSCCEVDASALHVLLASLPASVTSLKLSGNVFVGVFPAECPHPPPPGCVAEFLRALFSAPTHCDSDAEEGVSSALGAAGIAVLCRELSQRPDLTSLTLSSCGLRASDAVRLAAELVGLKAVAHLDLSHNPLGDVGVAALAACLPSLPRLRSLILRQTGLLSPPSPEARPCWPWGWWHARSSRSAAGTDLPPLANALQLSVAQLESVMFETAWGTGGVVTLARMLPHLPALSVLELGGNALGDRGVAELSAALPNLSALRELRLEAVGMDMCGASAVASGVALLPSLHALDVSRNGLNADAARVLQDALAKAAGTTPPSLHKIAP